MANISTITLPNGTTYNLKDTDGVTKEYVDGKLAPVEVSPTTAAYSIGDLLIYNGVLYKATADISVGATLTVGTNIAATDLDEVVSTLQTALTFDTTPTSGSRNPVTSGGVKTALDAKQDTFWATYGTTTNAEIEAAFAAGKICLVYTLNRVYRLVWRTESLPTRHVFTATQLNTVYWATCEDGRWYTGSNALQLALTFDTTPTSGSTRPVTSGGVKTALDGKTDPALTATITLTAAGWSNNRQTVSNDIFLANGYAYIIAPTSDSFTAYSNAGIYALDVDTDGQLTFVCSETPTAAITVHIMRSEVSA